MAQIPGASAPAMTTHAVAQQRLDGSGGADLNTPVRIVYTPKDATDTAPFVIHYAREKYACSPNVPTFVPYLAMVMYLGDPRAINKPGGKIHEQHRRTEVERLRVHWGVYERDEEWARVPNLKAYPIDSDVPFNTVLDDPDGANMDMSAVASRQQSDFIQSEMARMQAEMRAMQAQLQMAQQAEGARTAAGLDPDVPLDPQMTVSRTVAPESPSMVGAHPVARPASTKGRAKPQGENATGTGEGVGRDAPNGVGGPG